MTKLGLGFGCDSIRFLSAPTPTHPRVLNITPLLLSRLHLRCTRQQEMKLGMENERELDEDEKSSSECSSGCQSGWTMYLDDNGSISMNLQDGDDDDDDLSMVSDASSGPPHFHDNHDEHCHCCGNGSCSCSFSAASSGGKKRRVDAQQHEHIHAKQAPHSSPLDDTASSPFFAFPKTSFNAAAAKKKLFVDDVLELSCGSSATRFKGKSALRKHLGYFKSCEPLTPASVSMEGGEKKLR